MATGIKLSETHLAKEFDILNIDPQGGKFGTAASLDMSAGLGNKMIRGLP